ncbi:FMO-like domain-containing protein [Cephalotus follicularis]|uniref:Flavin-containing monooxygenase n=1 Tax=Cephalotus follicularis TaxID=3775 RepID=A0A1Q3C167_CEPFO|nr:FMO-like domain-containing protein [Cephalotus follicularis]
MEKRVAIIGAGVSGLLACKYTLEKGFDPVVFEAEEGIGGIWSHTIDSTRLQNVKEAYEFSDFPWPCSTKEMFPSHSQVMEYLESYAQHFGLYPYIKFNNNVIGIDFFGVTNEEMEAWDLWGGTGKPFGSKRMWHLKVQDTKKCTTEVYQAGFVVLCIGKFSGLPNLPKFPPDEGPEVFSGKVMHSMDYSAMDKSDAAKLIKNKKITIVGSFKSAVDIAAECADANGTDYPCTMIQRSAHWLLPIDYICGSIINFAVFTRFSGLLEHKPGESFLLSFLATLLSLLKWGLSKFAEFYLKWKLTLKEYGMIPKYSFLEYISSCQIAMLPDRFYDKVEEGSIILKKPQPHNFSFSKDGLIVDEKTTPLESDVVIFATGYKGDEKLKNIFEFPFFKECIAGPKAKNPLYRQIIHPRIPQLAVIGFTEGISNLFSSEIRCQWLAHFFDGGFKLPTTKQMEKEVAIWENYFNRIGKKFGKSCISNTHIWYNDQLCRDIGCNPKRKKGFVADIFEPYGPKDYVGLTPKVKTN